MRPVTFATDIGRALADADAVAFAVPAGVVSELAHVDRRRAIVRFGGGPLHSRDSLTDAGGLATHGEVPTPSAVSPPTPIRWCARLPWRHWVN